MSESLNHVVRLFMDSLLLDVADESASMTLYGDIGRYCDVDDRAFAAAMKEIQGKPLTVDLNSYGGEVATAQAIRVQLERHDAPVTIRIDGIAASAATIIACAQGAHVVMDAGAMYMIHAPLLDAGFANASTLRRAVDMLEKCGKTLLDVYVARTGMSAEKVIDMMEAETYLTAEQALKLGFIDEVSMPIEASASSNSDKARVLGYVRNSMEVKTMKNKKGVFLALEEEENVQEEEKQEEAVEEEETEAAEEEPAKEDEQQEPAEEEAESADEEPAEEEPKEDEPEPDADFVRHLMAKGAKRERERMRAIDEATLPGYEKMAFKAKYDKPMSASDFALAVLKSEKAKKAAYLSARATESEDVGSSMGASNSGVKRTNKSESLASEFAQALIRNAQTRK